MNINDSEELLALINRLLEQLHQAGPKNLGVRIQIVLEPEVHPETLPDPPCLGREKCTGELPEVLCTDKAMVLWQKTQQAGYVDEHYQPLLSRTQAALLADAMAGRLGIKEKWKVFEKLWNRKYMRSDYNLALTQQQSLDFQDDLKNVFE